MRRFKNILFAFQDGVEPDQAFDRAVEVAKRNGAALTIACSFHEPGVADPNRPFNLQATLAQAADGHLKELAAPLAAEGLAVDTAVFTGKPFIDLIRKVQHDGHDLLITTAQQPASFGAALFGGTTMHLLRKCPCPVWVVKPQRRRHYNRILAAVDPTREQAPGLTTLILQLATSMARLEGGELHVVHAWQLYGENTLRDSPFLRFDHGQMQELIDAEAAAHQRLFDEALEPFREPDLRLKEHLVRGNATDVISGVAATHQVDLIVMGTVARTGLAGFFIGDTAEETLHRVACAVLAVKPEGFVSPVQ